MRRTIKESECRGRAQEITITYYQFLGLPFLAGDICRSKSSGCEPVSVKYNPTTPLCFVWVCCHCISYTSLSRCIAPQTALRCCHTSIKFILIWKWAATWSHVAMPMPWRIELAMEWQYQVRLQPSREAIFIWLSPGNMIITCRAGVREIWF